MVSTSARPMGCGSYVMFANKVRKEAAAHSAPAPASPSLAASRLARIILSTRNLL